MTAFIALLLACVAYVLTTRATYLIVKHDKRLADLERKVDQLQLRKRINVDLVKHRARYAKQRVNSS